MWQTIARGRVARGSLAEGAEALDVVFFMWAGLVLLFFKAVVMRDMLNIVTLSLGFMVQSALMAMLIFK
jgi:hypothetical protein